MKNSELNQLTVQELRELRKKVTDMLAIKMQIEGKINADSLEIGDTIKYIGGSVRDKNETFEIIKINKVNARCKSFKTGITWNIKLGSIQKCEKSNSKLPNSIKK